MTFLTLATRLLFPHPNNIICVGKGRNTQLPAHRYQLPAVHRLVIEQVVENVLGDLVLCGWGSQKGKFNRHGKKFIRATFHQFDQPP